MVESIDFDKELLENQPDSAKKENSDGANNMLAGGLASLMAMKKSRQPEANDQMATRSNNASTIGVAANDQHNDSSVALLNQNKPVSDDPQANNSKRSKSSSNKNSKRKHGDSDLSESEKSQARSDRKELKIL